MAAYTGCIAGAILISDYEKGLKDAGFSAVQVVDAKVASSNLIALHLFPQ